MSTRDQLAVASLWGCAQRHAAKRTPVNEAVAELRAISTRGDVLARAAGTMAGAGGRLPAETQWAIAAARLLVQAGADVELLPRWIQQGRTNVAHGSGWTMGHEHLDDLDQVLADILNGVDG